MAVVGLDLDDRADEAAPVRAGRVLERSLERYGHGCGADVGDFQNGPPFASVPRFRLGVITIDFLVRDRSPRQRTHRVSR